MHKLNDPALEEMHRSVARLARNLYHEGDRVEPLSLQSRIDAVVWSLYRTDDLIELDLLTRLMRIYDQQLQKQRLQKDLAQNT